MYDVTNRMTFEHLDTWISEMKKYAGEEEIVIFLIANKMDILSHDPSSRQVSMSEGKEYAQKINAKYVHVHVSDITVFFCFFKDVLVYD